MGAMLSAVVTEIRCIPRSEPGALKSSAPQEHTILRAEQPHEESVRRVKPHDSGIVGFLVQNVECRINSCPEKCLMKSVRGASGTTSNVYRRDVRDLHGRVASMKRESGLYVRPSGSVSRWNAVQLGILLSPGPTSTGLMNPAERKTLASEYRSYIHRWI